MKQNKKYEGIMVDFSDLKKTIIKLIDEVGNLLPEHFERVGKVRYKVPDGYKLVKIGRKISKKSVKKK